MDKYKALKTLSNLISFIAWIEIIAAIILGVYFLSKEFTNEFTIQFVISTIVGGIVTFIFLLAFSKLIILALDIREHQLTNNLANPIIDRNEDVGQINPINEANVLKLADLIKKQKKGFFGSSNKSEVIEFLNSLVNSKEDCLKIIELYKNWIKGDVINDLKSLSSNYSVIKENLNCFIVHKIVSEEYPHEIIKVE